MYDLLIIGSEGFIGKNLVSFYKTKGWKLKGVDRLDNPSFHYTYLKLLNISDLTELLSRDKYKYIINAAGSGNVGFSMSHPLADFESNCLETARILEAIRFSGSECKYLHISSAAVYGNPTSLPVNESDLTYPLSPYGWHKLMSEFLCKEYYDLYNVKSCIIRPFSVYGPGLRKQLFWDIYLKAFYNSSVELFGTGNESRDFIYISDLLKAIDIVLGNATMTAEKYNLANGIQTSIFEVTVSFLKHFPNKLKVIFNGDVKEGDPLNWNADISKVKALGFKPEITIEQGLKLTYDWIQDYHQKNRSDA